MKHNRLIFWFFLLVFIGPWASAHVIYVMRDKFTFKTLETGTLLSPPIQAQSLPFFDATWLGKWQIVYIEPINCNAGCQTLMSMLTKIHAALGKEKYRVQYQIISTRETELVPPNILAPDNIALIDPRGWLIMHYPSHSDPHGILKDLRRLLMYSHDGQSNSI